MDKIEHLLTCAIEECAEVQHAVTKTLRFGLEDYYESGPTNQERIMLEFCDLLAVIEELVSMGVLAFPANKNELLAGKKEKIKKYMTYAEARGTLDFKGGEHV